jgi:hypothetical protein
MTNYLDKIRLLEDEYKTKLAKLEDDKSKLLDARRNELMKIIDKLNILNIDNDLIVGSLLIMKDNYLANDKSKLAIFQEKANTFFRKRKAKSKVTNSQETK